MMAWTHAVVGAAVGARSRNPAAAYTAGVVSHGIADLIPHRDYDMKIEVPLLVVTLMLIAWRYGVESKQFWGAVGGFSPDIENGLEMIGVTSGTLFPTHTRHPWFIGHGKMIDSPLPQVALAFLCVWIAEESNKK